MARPIRAPRIAPQAPTRGQAAAAASPDAAPSAGDLLFFAPEDAGDELIARGTGGPYAHCAVATGDGRVIEAIHRGVVLDTETTPALVLPTGARCKQLAPALAWVRRQVGRPYSYANLVDAAEAIVWAALQPHVGIGPISVSVPTVPFGALFQPGAFDCSSLCARFLLVAEYEPLPGALDANPDAASPNSLAWMLGQRW